MKRFMFDNGSSLSLSNEGEEAFSEEPLLPAHRTQPRLRNCRGRLGFLISVVINVALAICLMVVTFRDQDRDTLNDKACIARLSAYCAQASLARSH